MQHAHKADQTLVFNHTSSNIDTFYVDTLGSNTINYTTYVAGNTRDFLSGGNYYVAGRQAATDELGSLLAHEIGHTEIGLGSMGWTNQIPFLEQTDNLYFDENRTTSAFENDYRNFYGMPAVDTYSKNSPLGVCIYEQRCPQ